jgi:hypothetical protein
MGLAIAGMIPRGRKEFIRVSLFIIVGGVSLLPEGPISVGRLLSIPFYGRHDRPADVSIIGERETAVKDESPALPVAIDRSNPRERGGKCIQKAL